MLKSKNKKQKKVSFWKPFIFISFISFIIITLIYFLRHTNFYAKSTLNNLKTPQKELFKIHKTLVEHSNLMIGVDVSYYQQEINFDSLAIYFKRPIQVFICRASAGNNYKDSFVNRNIKKAF